MVAITKKEFSDLVDIIKQHDEVLNGNGGEGLKTKVAVITERVGWIFDAIKEQKIILSDEMKAQKRLLYTVLGTVIAGVIIELIRSSLVK